MLSVYNYRHVELDKVGRGKRVIQPPGGQAADIFGRPQEQAGSISSASSQAGSDVASSRIRIDTDQQSIASSNQMSAGQAPQQQQQQQQQQQLSGGQMSPTGSVSSSVMSGQQQAASVASSLAGDAFAPSMLAAQQQQQQQQQQQLLEVSRTPKKTIPVLRRNPITGEILQDPSERQQPVIRVRQPPGGHSSGIF